MNSVQNDILSEFLGTQIITPDKAGYDEARALYNGMIDKRPRYILRCETQSDVQAGIKFARANDLLLAIRGGGHNGPGLGSCDDGVVIDLSPMKAVDVDVDNSTVRVGAGCTQGEVDAVTSQHGLAVPAGIVSSTGIAGLTLGGGHGYLTRKYGLTIDNLLQAEVVLANGRCVTANEDQNADLFWSLKSGGGNFGVVTEFTFRAHPVDQVFAGPIFYDIAHATEIMRWYRDALSDMPRELCIFLGLKTVPSTDPFPQEIWGRRICALIACYNGSEEDGMAEMQAVHAALPEPLMDGMGPMRFVDVQGMFDPLLPAGFQWYWKGDFVSELTDEAIAAHVHHGSRSPSELSLMHLYPIDGAVHEVEPDATAWSARSQTWSMVIAGVSPDAGDADALKTWARDYWQAVHAENAHGGAYVNFMMDDEGHSRVAASYGDNFPRLQEIKRKYDPENTFRVNQNIQP